MEEQYGVLETLEKLICILLFLPLYLDATLAVIYLPVYDSLNNFMFILTKQVFIYFFFSFEENI